MCFSEQASFTTAAALALMGVICLHKVKDQPKLHALAAIPLFFALQQIAEGVQWLHFKEIWGTSQQSAIAKNIYLFFAYSFWPTWIPLAFYFAETNLKRKKILLLLLCGAFIFSNYTFWKFYMDSPAALPTEYSIQYYSSLSQQALWPYILFTISPWFLTTLPHMALIGAAYALSCFISGYVFETHFISIWCFFAACISIFLFFALLNTRKREFPYKKRP